MKNSLYFVEAFVFENKIRKDIYWNLKRGLGSSEILRAVGWYFFIDL
jgi:hypothetical protein